VLAARDYIYSPILPSHLNFSPCLFTLFRLTDTSRLPPRRTLTITDCGNSTSSSIIHIISRTTIPTFPSGNLLRPGLLPSIIIPPISLSIISTGQRRTNLLQTFILPHNTSPSSLSTPTHPTDLMSLQAIVRSPPPSPLLLRSPSHRPSTRPGQILCITSMTKSKLQISTNLRPRLSKQNPTRRSSWSFALHRPTCCAIIILHLPTCLSERRMPLGRCYP